MNKDDAKRRIDLLTDELHRLNTAYYNLDQSLVSDYEFDLMLKELEQLEHQYPEYRHEGSPTERVGGTVTKSFDSVVHKRAMLSLANSYSKEDISEWYVRMQKGLSSAEDLEVVCEQKIDGVAISLIYVNGILTQAITRGDGVQGDDVTANAKTIRSIPLKLQGQNWPSELEVRGEVYLSKEAFEKLNAELSEAEKYSNPRNTASGTLKLQDSKEVAKRKLDCYAYYLLSDELDSNTHSRSLELLRSWGFQVSPTWELCHGIDSIWKYIEKWETQRYDLPVETDGIVLKLNDLNLQKELGLTSKSPRWALAFKYKAASVSTALISVSYQVGRTGAITPVANLQPVALAGTVVKRATLHNADEMQRLGLCDGDIVSIEKGGDIIPKITAVVSNRSASRGARIQFPTLCPACGSRLVRMEGESAWYCTNDTNCEPQIKGKIEHFIHRKAANIESLGEGKIDVLFGKGLLRKISDLYLLKPDQLLGLEYTVQNELDAVERKISFQEKTVEKIMQGIENSRQVEFSRILFGLGIRFVGSTVSEKLAQYFGNIDAIAEASLEDLMRAPEVGSKIAQSVYNWFRSESNRSMVEVLKNAGLQLESRGTVGMALGTALSGKSFVVTGSIEGHTRESVEAWIEGHQGKILSGVSGKLDYLVIGESPGASKVEKAQKLGVKMISYQDLLEMIKEV